MAALEVLRHYPVRRRKAGFQVGELDNESFTSKLVLTFHAVSTVKKCFAVHDTPLLFAIHFNDRNNSSYPGP
jgi:hypothetical protein